MHACIQRYTRVHVQAYMHTCLQIVITYTHKTDRQIDGYTCIYVYKSIYIYLVIHNEHTYSYTCKCTCKHICYVYVYTCLCTHTYTYTHTDMIHLQRLPTIYKHCAYVYIYMCVHTYTCTYTYACICINTLSPPLPSTLYGFLYL